MRSHPLLKQTNIKTKRGLMIYITAAFFVFVATILSVSIVMFLMERFEGSPKKAIFYAGLLLGAASFFGIFVDAVWGSLQRKFRPKTLLFWAAIGLMLTVSIFLLSHTMESLQMMLFTILAAFSFGWSLDLYDVTMMTTVLRRSDKSQYAQSISQKKVAEVIGMISGLIISSILWAIGGAIFVQITLLVLLIIVIFFIFL